MYIDNNTEDFAEGVQRIWFYERRIVVYRVPRATRAAMDVWLEVATETGVNWPIGQRYLGMHDFSATNPPLSPKVYAGALKMAYDTRHLDGYFCGVLQPTSIGAGLVRILDANIMPIVPRLKMHIFYDTDAALAWLVRHMD